MRKTFISYQDRIKNKRKPIFIAIIGAGEAGSRLLDELCSNEENNYRVWCFIDDNTDLIGQRHNGVKVKGPINSISDILKGSPVSELILAIPSNSNVRTREILDLCSKLPYNIKLLPSTVIHENNNIAYSIRAIKLEDLLGRSCVCFENEELHPFLTDKVILVTGGGGSIGSELCRQIASFRPKKLILLDIIENNVYLLKNEIDFRYNGSIDVVIEIASICDERRIEGIFSKYRPDIVYHAAAHKHVPLMEQNPGEAVKNNIFATYNLIKLSTIYCCSKFVMLSTDKAVNPTNVMGASKRYCEMMIQAMADVPENKTDFVAVRFGNVLGSEGSVVPLFMNQIERGGPITITDKRIIRYFMTVSEAVALVLKAGAMAKKSEIFVLDMGDPVKIITLAENMVRLAGLKPYKDIQIIETGLRPGEKLYEELLVIEDTNTATSEHKIFIEKQNSRIRLTDIEKGVTLLHIAMETENDELITAAIKKLVPTFKNPEEVNSCVAEITEVKIKAICSA
jgi:FlaA1/EpsC-like NDP-sugar epimerase